MHKPTPADTRACQLIRALLALCLLSPLAVACATTAPDARSTAAEHATPTLTTAK